MSALSIMVKPVSGACNMHCRYCFYSDVMAHRETAVYPRMSIEALETLVRRAFRYADDSLCFSFQGGEPTLAGEEFFEALVRFERMYNTRGIPVQNAVQTNGYALSDEMRLPLVLREIHSLSYEEVAQTLGLEMGTVKSRIHRAREKLAKMLTGEVQEERRQTL